MDFPRDCRHIRAVVAATIVPDGVAGGKESTARCCYGSGLCQRPMLYDDNVTSVFVYVYIYVEILCVFFSLFSLFITINNNNNFS